MKGTRNRSTRVVLDQQEILSYWFPPGIHEADAGTYREQWLHWFAGGPEVEREITERFGGVLEQARRGELGSWAETPRGRLALIIVLDQFPAASTREHLWPTPRTPPPYGSPERASRTGWTATWKSPSGCS